MRILLTGRVGSGKTTILNYIEKMGFHTIKTDDITHEVLTRSNVKNSIKQTFGKSVFSPNGEVDRNKLADIVFSSPKKLNILEAITQQIIKKKINELTKGKDIFIVESALPLPGFDRVILVESPASERKMRLKKSGREGHFLRDAFQEENIKGMYRREDIYTIKNTSPKESFRQVEMVLEKLRKEDETGDISRNI